MVFVLINGRLLHLLGSFKVRYAPFVWYISRHKGCQL